MNKFYLTTSDLECILLKFKNQNLSFKEWLYKEINGVLFEDQRGHKFIKLDNGNDLIRLLKLLSF